MSDMIETICQGCEHYRDCLIDEVSCSAIKDLKKTERGKPVIFFGEGLIAICDGKYDGSEVDNCIMFMQSDCKHCIGDPVTDEFEKSIEHDDPKRLATLVFTHPDSIEVLIEKLERVSEALAPQTEKKRITVDELEAILQEDSNAPVAVSSKPRKVSND